MSRFVQLHVLTSYPPANLNRDDTGRPKSAIVGGALRLRISSQSLKRAWRTSGTFMDALPGHIGTRTKMLGGEVLAAMLESGASAENAGEWAPLIAAQFGKLKPSAKGEAPATDIEQLAHVGPDERRAALQLARDCATRGTKPGDDELKLLRKPREAADIAMFGRMLAGSPAFNVDAAVQVAHAFTVHKSAIEDDYFSAVDDLNTRQDDAGAGHIGERGYGAGLFYLYVCINRELLLDNLGGDVALADRATAALVHAITKVGPTGMQNSFASRAYASFVLAERGDQQPRSLSQAFVRPVSGTKQGLLDEAVEALLLRRDNFDKVYGACSDANCSFNVETGSGSLDEVIRFVATR